MISILAVSIVGVATPSFGVAVGENYFVPLDGKPFQLGTTLMTSIRIPLSNDIAFMGQIGILHSAPIVVSPRIGTGVGLGISKDFSISISGGYQYNPNDTHSVALLVTPSIAIAQNTRLNLTAGATYNMNIYSSALIFSPTISFQF